MPAGFRWSGQVAELAPLVMATAGHHAVQLYEDDAFLVEVLARVVGEAFDAGDAAVTITTGDHRRALETRLSALGIDIDAARAGERYFGFDADEMLARFMTDGTIDGRRFGTAIGMVLDRAAGATRHGQIRAFAEMVARLWGAGARDAALAVEELWNVALRRHRTLSLLCAYPLTAFGSAEDTARFTAMCRHHTHVVPTERYAGLERPGERLRGIAAEQQRAVVLERELTRGSTRELSVACRFCGRVVLRASRIASAEADALTRHLRSVHPGVLGQDPVMLGDVLRLVTIGES
jgi:hypothetical protein